MALRTNIAANYLGKAWAAAVNFFVVPFYLKFLGVGLYGLIGMYLFMVAVFAVLDLGLSTTLSRMLAQRTSSTLKGADFRDLIKTFAIAYWAVGGVIAAAMFICSPLIADHWLDRPGVPREIVVHSLRLMAGVFVFQWPVALYSGGLSGLERQPLLNLVRSTMTTVQAGGAVLVLWLIAPTIDAFFIWQLCATAAQAWVLARCFAGSLPPELAHDGRYRARLLASQWHFSAGTMGITLVGTIVMQLDKVLLGKMYPLAVFGGYMLANSMMTALSAVAFPMSAALFPRFARLAGESAVGSLTELYHKSCHLMTSLVAPVGITVAVYSNEVLLMWIREPSLVASVSPILRVMAIATVINSIMQLPFSLQLATGWTSLSLYKNCFTLVWLVPLLYLAIAKYGAVGAAGCWLAVNLSYFLYEPIFMHRKILKSQAARWYALDVCLPLIAVTATAVAVKLISRQYGGMIPVIVNLLACWLVAGAISRPGIPQSWAQRWDTHRLERSAR